MAVPKLSELIDSITTSLESSIGQSIPLLPKSFLRVLAKVLAGVALTMYKYAGFTFLQSFPTTATMSDTEVNGKIIQPLIELGRTYGVGDPTSATRAELLIDINVLTQTGQLEAGTSFINVETGVVYQLLSTVLLNSATVQGTVRATRGQEGSPGEGTIGNMEAGETLQFISPPATVSRTATVDSQVLTAAEAESEDAYRQRVLDRIQKPPRGGNYSDYELWAESRPGIVAAYPYTGTPGTVNIYIVATEESSGDPDGIPTAAQLTDVEDYINGATVKPAGPLVSALASTPASFDVDIVGLSPDTSELQADVTSAISDWLVEREPFIAGLSIVPRKDAVTLHDIAGVVGGITSAQSATFDDISVDLVGGGANPITSYTLGEGERAKVRNVTFT